MHLWIILVLRARSSRKNMFRPVTRPLLMWARPRVPRAFNRSLQLVFRLIQFQPHFRGCFWIFKVDNIEYLGGQKPSQEILQ